MKRSILIMFVTTLSVGSLGCSMCCGPFDYDYPVYGGKFERVDSSDGRVGSVFSDPNASSDGENPDSNLEAQPDGGDSRGVEELPPPKKALETFREKQTSAEMIEIDVDEFWVTEPLRTEK